MNHQSFITTINLKDGEILQIYAGDTEGKYNYIYSMKKYKFIVN